MTLKLTPAQLDRACGAALDTAVADALGAPYEFGSASIGPEGPRMIGGGFGNFAPGEWTDDTTMASAILDVAATGSHRVSRTPALRSSATSAAGTTPADPTSATRLTAFCGRQSPNRPA